MTVRQEEKRSLFDRLTKSNDLKHPTANNFNEADWDEAFQSLDDVSDKDVNLYIAAKWFSHQLSSLWQQFGSPISELDRKTAILLAIAQSNREYVLIDKRAKGKARKNANGEVVDLELSVVI